MSNEQSAAPKSLVIHEVMGRHCGWLTAATARAYIQDTKGRDYVEGLMMNTQLKNIDGMYLPEIAFDLEGRGARLRKIMEKTGFVTIFVTEGAGLDTIVAEREAAGEHVKRDAFGHVKIDTINVGNWFSKHIGHMIGAERAMVQKSGYYARSAPANRDDLRLIQSMVDLAVESALNRVSGVTGHDEDQNGKLRTIEFERIKGGKHFDTDQPLVLRSDGLYRSTLAGRLKLIFAGAGPAPRRFVKFLNLVFLRVNGGSFSKIDAESLNFCREKENFRPSRIWPSFFFTPGRAITSP